MNILTVTTKQLTYPIYFDKTYDFLKSVIAYAGLSTKKAVIISDSNISSLYLDAVHTRLSDVFDEVSRFIFPAGEQSKNLDVIRDIYAFFVEKQLDRKSVIFALGGGVTGDIAGFAAATYMRGLPYVQLPTSLLAQVDSGVGGKVGVDFMRQKNFIGAFYQPRFVYVNIETLKTLPAEQFVSGLGECIKHGLIRNADYYRFIKENVPEITGKQTSALTRLIEESCGIKAEIVQKDEREDHLRKLLNFGHTFGHALETISDFSILHGHCVAYGMRAGLYMSYQLGRINKETVTEFDAVIKNYGFPKLERKFNPSDIYKQMFSDKKAEEGQIHIIALDSIGSAYIETKTTKQQIIGAIEHMLNL